MPTSFTKSLFTMLTGSLSGQIITLAMLPVIARLYSSAHYGEFATCIAVSAICTPLTTLRLDQALLAEGGIDRKRSIFYLVISIAPCTVLLLAILHAAANEPLLGVLGSTPQVAMVLIGSVILTILQTWHLANGRVRITAISKITFAATTGAAQIALASQETVNGLSVGYAVGTIIASIPMTVSMYRFDRNLLDKVPSKKRLLLTLYRLRDYPKISTATSIVNMSCMHAPQLIINTLCGPSISGQFAMANKLTKTPISAISHPMSGVITQQMANSSADRKNSTEELLKLLSRQRIAAFAIIVLMMLMCPRIIPLILGESWHQTVNIALALAPLLYSLYQSQLISGLYNVFNKQKQLFVFNCLFLASLSPLFLTPVIGLEWAVLSTSALSGYLRIIYCSWILNHINPSHAPKTKLYDTAILSAFTTIAAIHLA